MANINISRCQECPSSQISILMIGVLIQTNMILSEFMHYSNLSFSWGSMDLSVLVSNTFTDECVVEWFQPPMATNLENIDTA